MTGDHRRTVGAGRRAEPVPAHPVHVLGKGHLAVGLHAHGVDGGVHAPSRHARGARARGVAPRSAGPPAGQRRAAGRRVRRCRRRRRRCAEGLLHRRARRRLRPGKDPGRRRGDGEGHTQHGGGDGGTHGGPPARQVSRGCGPGAGRPPRRRRGRRATARRRAAAASRRPTRPAVPPGTPDGAECPPLIVWTASLKPASCEPHAYTIVVVPSARVRSAGPIATVGAGEHDVGAHGARGNRQARLLRVRQPGADRRRRRPARRRPAPPRCAGR